MLVDWFRTQKQLTEIAEVLVVWFRIQKQPTESADVLVVWFRIEKQLIQLMKVSRIQQQTLRAEVNFKEIDDIN